MFFSKKIFLSIFVLLPVFLCIFPDITLGANANIKFFCDGYHCSAKDMSEYNGEGMPCNAGHDEDCTYYACIKDQCVLRPLYQKDAISCGNSAPNQSICDAEKEKNEKKEKTLQYMCDGYTCAAKDPTKFKGMPCNAGHDEDCTYYACIKDQCVLRPLYQKDAISCGNSAPNQSICDAEKEKKKTQTLQYMCDGYSCALKDPTKFSGESCLKEYEDGRSGPNDSACRHYICSNKQCVLRPISDTNGGECARTDTKGAVVPDNKKCQKTDGKCGILNKGPWNTKPVDGDGGLCSLGDPTAVAGPADGPWTWTCDGWSGGASVACSAVKDAGKCGILNKGPWNTKPVDGDGGLCSLGDPTAVAGPADGPWTWDCNSQSGGLPAHCSAVKVSSSECGPAAEKYFYNAPTNDLCKDNSTPTVSYDAGLELWSWKCSSSLNKCFAFKKVDATCGSSIFTSKPDLLKDGDNLCGPQSFPSAVSGPEDGPWTWTCFTSAATGGKDKPCTGTKSATSKECTYYEYGDWLPCYPGDEIQRRFVTKALPAGCWQLNAKITQPCPASCYCSGHGTCNTDNTCKCDAGYAGAHCDTLISNDCSMLNDCSNHGTCVALNFCSCNIGWSGTNCNSCAAGFVKVGDDCRLESCNTSTCNGHGHGTCTCKCGTAKTNFFGGFVGSLLNSYIDKIKSELLASSTTCSCSCACNGNWDPAEQCGKCKAGYFGPNCLPTCNFSCTKWQFSNPNATVCPAYPNNFQTRTCVASNASSCTGGTMPEIKQDCTPSCAPDCANKECGDNGCGGTCSPGCLYGETCNSSGRCETGCTPNCTNRECGDNGCGGSCGSCAWNETCNVSGRCDLDCTPYCVGRTCGGDGCGGTCGTCSSGQTCNASGQCTSSCTSNCTGKVCGDDGCGGTCGTCAWNETCLSGQCEPNCTPYCVGRTCGGDGCGGSCGTCSSGQTCNASGQCTSSCTSNCTGKVCGDDGCGGTCGTCAWNETCNTSGQCTSSCTPNCTGKCGGADDGCGGTCNGGCLSGQYCIYQACSTYTHCWTGGMGNLCTEIMSPPDMSCQEAGYWSSMQECCNYNGPRGGDDCTMDTKLCYGCQNLTFCVASDRVNPAQACSGTGLYESRSSCISSTPCSY